MKSVWRRGHGLIRKHLTGIILKKLLLEFGNVLDCFWEQKTPSMTPQGMGVHAIRNWMDVHNTALALVCSCHLQRLRACSLKFLGFLLQWMDSDSGLRSPNVLEAHAALYGKSSMIWSWINNFPWTMASMRSPICAQIWLRSYNLDLEYQFCHSPLHPLRLLHQQKALENPKANPVRKGGHIISPQMDYRSNDSRQNASALHAIPISSMPDGRHLQI